MQHHIPTEALGPDGAGMARAVAACVHCGFCLPACPTYRVLGEEMDSPRGRILLMKQVLEGALPASEAFAYVDRCLGCLACETACPSGVRYRDLVVPYRAHTEPTTRSWPERLRRRALLAVLESPTLFRAALRLARLASPLAALGPAALRASLNVLPQNVPEAVTLPALTPAVGRRRARVALLSGCVQHVLRPSISLATIRVLSANGIEVVVPADQGCCGALALHAGHRDHGTALSARHAAAFPSDVDAIVSTAAGCGSAMKDAVYPAPVRDVAELLDGLGLSDIPAFAEPTTIAYQDACHLAHGQGIRAAPRRLLARIGQATVVEIAGGDTCCGSAGLYNVEYPEIAGTLGTEKAARIRDTGAALVATGNIGCLNQLTLCLGGAPGVRVLHTMEVLDSAYSSSGARSGAGRES